MRTTEPKTRARTLPVQPAEAVLVLMVLLLLIAAVLLSAPRPSEELFTETVTVSAGDTIWSLAKTHPVPGMSTGEAVALVVEINGLKDSCLQPGDNIELPVPKPEQERVAMR